jgi:hypothetical protein
MQFSRQKKHFSFIKIKRLILFKNITTFYYENNMKSINTLCGLNCKLLIVKAVVHMVTAEF